MFFFINTNPIKILNNSRNSTTAYIIDISNVVNFIKINCKGISIIKIKKPSINDNNKVFPPLLNIKNITTDNDVIIYK